MRVEVTTIEDFCSELRIDAEKEQVWNKEVRYRIDRSPEQDEEISFQVGIWLTAIVDVGEDRYILELGVPTGCDHTYVEGEDDNVGTRLANGWKQRVQEICDDVGLILRPGKFELY